MASQTDQPQEWIIRKGEVADLPKIEPLWLALYHHHRDSGMTIEIPSTGFKEWEASMKPGLGRFTCLFVAEIDREVIGFVSGWLRTLAAFYGKVPVGFLGELYISDKHQSKGIGHVLLDTGIEFFAKQGINRVEGQVLVGNTRARKAYRDWGWSEEFVQIVWQRSPK
jgi:GNAT superfamily N-acetyltransferase